MVIETKYRDIPFEEAVKCYSDPGPDVTPERWELFRGRPVLIRTPAIDTRTMTCDGPVYAVDMPVKADGRRVAVCPHIALIGD